MNFARTALAGFGTMPVYSAYAGPWQFIILQDMGKWSASYRLRLPKSPVSASSTIMGPFVSFDDAEAAAQEKLTELKRLA